MADFTLSAKLLGDSSSLQKACSGAAKAVGVAASAIATAAAATVVKIGKDSLEAYADYEQLTGGIETLFGDAYDSVMKNAENAYKTAGLSANSYMEQVTSFSASLLQATGKDTEKAASIADMAMQDMADNANKMGTAMESIQNAYQGFAKQNYTMLDNLKLGYGGTKEEMQRLLTNAQKITGVKYDISNLADVYSAIHAVQGELGISGISAEEAAEAVRTGAMTEEEAFDAMGTTAKEAATTIQGSVGMMKASWDNLLVGVADDQQDFDTLMNNFIDSVITVGENIIPRVEIIIEGVGTLLSSLIQDVLPMLMEQIPNILNNILPLVITAAGALLDSIVAVLPGIVDVVVAVLPQIISGILSFLPALLSAGIEILVALIDGINSMLPNILDVIVDVILQLVDVITQPDMLSGFIMSAVTLILTLANGLVDAIPQLLPAIPTIITNVVIAFTNLLPELIPVALELITVFAKALITAIPIIMDSLPIIFDSIINAFENVDWGQIGRNIIDGLINGLKSMISSLGNTVVNIAQGISDSFKSSLGIHSPSTLFMEYGVYTGEGYAIGIDKSADEIYKSFDRLNLTYEARKLPGVSDFNTSNISMSGGTYASVVDYTALGDYIVAAMTVQGRQQADALKDGISGMRMTLGTREAGRFISDMGFVRG